MNDKKTIVWGMLILISVGVMLYALLEIHTQYQEYKAAEDEYDKLAGLAHGITGEDDTSDANGLDDNIGRDSDQPYESPLDFTALREINPDVIGWITIGGTSIDYPIVQGEDNRHYLYSTYSGAANSSGSIFMDYRNAADFTDQNTIIYGHKMKNGTMFHDLSKYKSQSFFDTHPTFTLYTPEQEYRCEVFAAYVTSSVSETYVLEFPDAASFVQYLNMAIDGSLIRTGTQLGPTDKIITLSTCDYTYDNARMVVHARLH